MSINDPVLTEQTLAVTVGYIESRVAVVTGSRRAALGLDGRGIRLHTNDDSTNF